MAKRPVVTAMFAKRRSRKKTKTAADFEIYKVRLFLTEQDVTNPPVMGECSYLVIAEDDETVELFHPFTLTHLKLPKRGRPVKHGQPFNWETNPKPAELDKARMAEFIEKRAAEWVRLQMAFPGNVTRQLVADLRGVPIEEIEPMKTTQAKEPKAAKAAKAPKEPKGPGVIETLVKLIKKSWQTEDQLVEGLKAAFPDRDADKMRKTVRTQLSRIPKERGIALDKDKEKGVRLAA